MKLHDLAPAYGSAPAWPVGSTQKLYLSGTADLVQSAGQVKAGTASFTNTVSPGPASYSETSALQTSPPFSGIAPSDPAGTFVAYSTPPLAAAVDSVGIPTVDLTLSDANPAGALDPSLQVTIFAKIYDVAPDGTRELVRRLVSPARLADLSKPVHINLPGVSHRYAAGHVVQLVLATTDQAYVSSRSVHALSITADPAHPGVLSLPVLNSEVKPAAVTGAAMMLPTAGGGGLPLTATAPPSAAAWLAYAVLALLGLLGGLGSRTRRRKKAGHCWLVTEVEGTGGT